MTSRTSDLAEFGWSPFFDSQLDPIERTTTLPARVMSVHRSTLVLSGPGVETTTTPFAAESDDEEAVATVGDWLLLDAETLQPTRLLDRKSLFKRRAAGTERRLQLIAANVDTLFIVTSCNRDFNVARLERYLALAREADVTPIIVLTKTDLVDSPADYIRDAAKLLPGLLVEAVNARDRDSVAALSAWCGPGQTVALVGSSGVGKSTMANSLSGVEHSATQSVREGDARGRHTTTARALHRLPTGGWLLDSPGMRELQMTDVKAGLDELFADLVALAADCRFGDCSHEGEPGCAVQEAARSGAIDAARLKRWLKLAAEEAFNTSSLAERRARDRSFGKMVKRAVKAKRPRGR